MARVNETNAERGIKIGSQGACRALWAQRKAKGRLSESKILMDMDMQLKQSKRIRGPLVEY